MLFVKSNNDASDGSDGDKTNDDEDDDSRALNEKIVKLEPKPRPDIFTTSQLGRGASDTI